MYIPHHLPFAAVNSKQHYRPLVAVNCQNKVTQELKKKKKKATVLKQSEPSEALSAVDVSQFPTH